MLQTNRFALKEWAVVVKGLTTGRQLILLRKGGIEEDRGEFHLEHAEFFLYPTFEHQHRKHLRPEFHSEFDQAIQERPPNEDLIISGYAEVVNSIEATDLERLWHLAGYHMWTNHYLEMRFRYRPDRPLYVLLLRAYQTIPVQIPYRAEYRGCKSWVELDRELSTAAAQPALRNAEFESRRKAILSLLGAEASYPAVHNSPVRL